jgi:hypothetical protein
VVFTHEHAGELGLTPSLRSVESHEKGLLHLVRSPQHTISGEELAIAEKF